MLIKYGRIWAVSIGVGLGWMGAAEAAIFSASGQRLTPAVPGVHDDIRENFIYAIDSNTGIATPSSPPDGGYGN